MEQAPDIYLKFVEALKWPAFALVGLMFGLYILRQPLARLLDRTHGIKYPGGGLDASPNDQAGVSDGKNQTDTPDGKAAGELTPEDELLRQFDNNLLVETEQAIIQVLEARGVQNLSERERTLVRFLAAATIGKEFERVYRIIWGSQIAALEFVNQQGAAGVTVETLKPWFQMAVSRAPELRKNDTLERWLSYLEGVNFVERREQSVFITLRGREFLKYLIDQGYTAASAG